ncbi:hypothetical protein ILYODFUR_018492 [Ilyodon furcidens]|uniref:Uncharacterized protein n=1 Tax=Ilyodon furcidens TaxID=33524 RepID=A0ABV0UT42_9TELE
MLVMVKYYFNIYLILLIFNHLIYMDPIHNKYGQKQVKHLYHGRKGGGGEGLPQCSPGQQTTGDATVKLSSRRGQSRLLLEEALQIFYEGLYVLCKNREIGSFI